MIKKVFSFLFVLSLLSLVGAGAYSSNFNTGDSVKVTTSFFTGNLTNLSEMQDVNIPNPTNLQLFQYRTSNNKWNSYSFILSDWWDFDYNDLINTPTALSDFSNDLGIGNWTKDKVDYWNTSTNLITTSNITAGYFIGDGSLLTNIDASVMKHNYLSGKPGGATN